jgi:hypothetical protein
MTRPIDNPAPPSSPPARPAAGTSLQPRVLLLSTGTSYCQSLGFPRPNVSFP